MNILLWKYCRQYCLSLRGGLIIVIIFECIEISTHCVVRLELT